MPRLIFDAIPRTGSNSIVLAAESSGLSWQRAYRRETLAEFLAADDNADRDLWVSHYLFRDYEPGPDEALFTWVRDPVDLFASGFHYWRIADVRGDEFGPDMRDFMQTVRDFPDLRAYVDFVLENNSPAAFPRGLFDRDWSRYAFVGNTARMLESVAAFNDRFGTELPYLHVNGSGAQPLRYRRDELDEFFEPELEQYVALACSI